MARKPNYDYEKRKREADRKAKKDAKKEEKARRKALGLPDEDEIILDENGRPILPGNPDDEGGDDTGDGAGDASAR